MVGQGKKNQKHKEVSNAVRFRQAVLAGDEGKIDEDETQRTRKKNTHHRFPPQYLTRASSLAPLN